MAFVRAIDLVDRDDRTETALQGFRDDELRLRQRAFRGVHQHDDAVDHVQDALDLATEVGVAWSINDVDARVLPLNARALGEDGDAALALDVVGIHRALGDLLVFTEGAGLLQKLVDEGRLAMVNVRDDRDIAKGHLKPEVMGNAAGFATAAQYWPRT